MKTSEQMAHRNIKAADNYRLRGVLDCQKRLTAKRPWLSLLGEILINLTLLFADDIKIFVPTVSPQSSELLQSDLDNINNWCMDNKLYLNVNKCFIMSITKKAVATNYNYKVNNLDLKRVQLIIGFGIIYEFKLQLMLHIQSVISECSKLLGFIIHNSSSFQNIGTVVL